MTFPKSHLCILLLALASSVFCADPCYDIGPDNETEGYATCIQRDSCIRGPAAENACPSHPADFVCCHHHVFPGPEHRGVWIASVTNIDWPRSPTSSVATQQEELRHLVDRIAEAGLNAIYFQVRPAGDAFYQSDIEPWSVYLTGQQGTPPSPLWDPLQYVIDYCKPLNIEVHAWINPYRASLSPSTNGLAPNHMALEYPRCAYPFSTYLWMDPGCPEVQNRTYSVAVDLVTRYDLAGLHMDDYFYPYPVSGITFPDRWLYDEYVASGGTMSLDDWRRDNVNTLVGRLNNGLHAVKPWIKFSISPFGIYRPGHPEGMPPPIAGLDQYSELYCDPKKWMVEGMIDILQPQLYWRIDPPAQSYPILLDWWVSATQNPLLRHVYAGLYLTRVDIQDWPITEVLNQINISRDPQNRKRGSWGNVQFSAKMFRDDFEGVVGFFKTFIYPTPALQPLFPWLSNSSVSNINEVAPNVAISKTTLEIELTVPSHLEIEAIHQVVLYRMNSGQWEVFRLVPQTDVSVSKSLTLSGLSSGKYAVSFVNRIGEESRKSYFDI